MCSAGWAVQIAALGAVDRVVVGPEVRNYDVYAFVFYPSVDVFEVMFTAKERVEAQVHQRAGLNAERSAGYWVKPYPQFTAGVESRTPFSGNSKPALAQMPVSWSPRTVPSNSMSMSYSPLGMPNSKRTLLPSMADVADRSGFAESREIDTARQVVIHVEDHVAPVEVQLPCAR